MACRVNTRTIVNVRVLKRIPHFVRVICRFNCLLHKLEIYAAGITVTQVPSNKIIRKESGNTEKLHFQTGFCLICCFASSKIKLMYL